MLFHVSQLFPDGILSDRLVLLTSRSVELNKTRKNEKNRGNISILGSSLKKKVTGYVLQMLQTLLNTSLRR